MYPAIRRRRPNEPYVASLIGDFVRWHLPLLHGFEMNRSMVNAAEMLRLSLNSGSTVNAAIENVLGLDLNNCFRKRVRQWLERVEAGENISLAARQSRLPRCLAWAFDDQTNKGNTPTILETLESWYRSNYNYRLKIAEFVLGPCVVVILGAMVGFVVYAMYSAPVAIIHSVADAVYP